MTTSLPDLMTATETLRRLAVMGGLIVERDEPAVPHPGRVLPVRTAHGTTIFDDGDEW